MEIDKVKLDKFKIENEFFYEKINIKKLNYIINNQSKYEDIIKEQEKDMRRLDKNYNVFSILQKIKNNIIIPYELIDSEYGLIKVSYNKGRNSNGIGRWYAKNGIGIQPLCCCIRHTICENIWIDIDQVNSHPTILYNLMIKYKFKLKLLTECFTNRELFLEKIMKDEKCSRDTAKTYVIAVINGANYSSKILKNLANEIKPLIDYIINLPENLYIVEFVKKTYPNDNNIDGKIISRILQIIENNLLELYLIFFKFKGLIENNQVALIFDGFQVLKNDTITDELLDECRKYALEKTGYDIQLKIKSFDNCLSLPINYIEYDDDLSYLIDKYNININDFIEKNKGFIDIAIIEEGSHKSISNVAKCLLKETIVYDESCDLWFYCNINNIWKKSKTPFILKGLLLSVISNIFKIYSNNLKNLLKEDIEDNKTYNINIDKKSKDAIKISLKLHNNTFIKAIAETSKIDFNKDKFFETKIDTNGYLFAFTNILFDFQINQFRNITPNDYIMTNTEYDYPEYVDNESTKILEDYFNIIYPDKDVKEYMLDSFTIMLNGNRTEQSFNIHCGNGSNSKSTLFTAISKILGGYYLTINPETITKPKQSANSTGELYKAKGKRGLCTNEPECDKDNKIQGGLIKNMAGGSKEKIKDRGLYQEAIEFNIFFKLDILCNNKPTLNSIDGGIARRIRIINYLVKFVDDPIKDNKYQAKRNPSMMDIMTSDKIRNAFIVMLINRWLNRTSQIKTLIVPKQIQEDSMEYVESCNEVLGFIMDNYEITNNETDRIKSSELFQKFIIKTHNKMTTSKFKDDILTISGIIYKQRKDGRYFCGLKEKIESEEINE